MDSRASSSIPDGPIVSVFDFDGTLFRSPSPSDAAVRAHPRVAQPYNNKGLGWFHNRRSLEAPYVPSVVGAMDAASAALGAALAAVASSSSSGENNTVFAKGAFQKQFDAAVAACAGTCGSASYLAALPADSFDRWFITPTVAAYTEAKARGDATYILTGREVAFYGRVEALLAGAGLAFDGLLLKSAPGTIAFKVDALLGLLRAHRPRRLVYYEDRPDQGRKIYAGLVRAIEAAFGEYEPEVAAYYTHGGAVEVVLVPKAALHADTLLPADAEAQLLTELIADAPAACTK